MRHFTKLDKVAQLDHPNYTQIRIIATTQYKRSIFHSPVKITVVTKKEQVFGNWHAINPIRYFTMKEQQELTALLEEFNIIQEIKKQKENTGDYLL